jgi:hypothetical protein
MSEFMTIEQILDAARSDINRQIKNGTFKGYDECTDNEENFYTISSLYAQWAKNSNDAEIALDRMYAEEYPEFFK